MKTKEMKGGLKLLKTTGGILLIVGGIFAFSKFIIESNIGVY